jgi:hypothetical protein
MASIGHSQLKINTITISEKTMSNILLKIRAGIDGRLFYIQLRANPGKGWVGLSECLEIEKF